MKLRKKGISPLIATVLIIGFTVALAAVIMTWGSSFTKSMQASTEESTQTQLVCAQEVSLAIKSACIAQDKTYVKVVFENKGGRELINITTRLSTAPETVAPVSVGGLAAYGIKAVQIYTTAPSSPTATDFVLSDSMFNLAGVKQVEGIPVIRISNKEITCSGSVGTTGDASGGLLLPPCTA